MESCVTFGKNPSGKNYFSFSARSAAQFSARPTAIFFIFHAIHKLDFKQFQKTITRFSVFGLRNIFSGKSQICSCDFEVVAILFAFVTWTPWLQLNRGRSQDFVFFACGTAFSEKSQICSCDFEVVAILFVFVTGASWLRLAGGL